MNKIYIPMTRMNFIAALDAQVIAPPNFYKKYHHDLSYKFKEHILAFSAIDHFNHEEWNKYLEDEVNEKGEHDIEVELHFPLIIEVEIKNKSRVKTYKKGENKAKFISWKNNCISRDLVFVNCLIPLSRITRIYVAGSKLSEALHEDPILEESNRVFDIEVLSERLSENNNLLDLLNSDHTENYPEAIDLNLAHQYFAILGAIVMLMHCSENQNLETCDEYSDFILNILHRIITSNSYEQLASEECSELDLALTNSFSTGYNRSKYKINYLDAIEDNFDGLVSEENNLFSNQKLMKEMFIMAMSASPDGTSAQALIEKAYKSYSDKLGLFDKEDRISKAAPKVVEVLDGRRPIEELFARGVEWATSIRMSLLFALREKPNEYLTWSFDDLPTNSNLIDYYNGAFLCGLFNGLTLLPRNIKNTYQNIIDISLEKIADKKKGVVGEVKSRWVLEGKNIHGTFQLSYKNVGKIELRKKIGIESIIRAFVDKVIDENTIESDEVQRTLSLIANQCKKYEFNYRRVNLDGKHDPYIDINSEALLAYKCQWDFDKIISWLDRDAAEIHLPEEIIHLLCRYANIPSELFEPNIIVDDKETLAVSLIEKYINNLEEQSFDDELEISSIHNKGIALCRELLKLLLNNKIKNKSNISDIKSLFFYLILENDVISEVYDTDIGYIDDWLFAINCIGGLKPESNLICNKEIGELQKRAGCLDSEIKKLFGEEFTKTIVSRIHYMYSAWRSLKD